jgi:predicted nucleic acid-binding protein
MAVLDTNVLSELMRTNPSEAVVGWVRKQTRLLTTAVTIAEIYYGLDRLPAGARKSRLVERAEAILAEIVGQVLPFDAAAAREYASILSSRDRAGTPMSTLDAQIAAICLANRQTLVTRNVKDFADTGLNVLDPWNL